MFFFHPYTQKKNVWIMFCLEENPIQPKRVKQISTISIIPHKSLIRNQFTRMSQLPGFSRPPSSPTAHRFRPQAGSWDPFEELAAGYKEGTWLRAQRKDGQSRVVFFQGDSQVFWTVFPGCPSIFLGLLFCKKKTTCFLTMGFQRVLVQNGLYCKEYS